MRKVYLFLLFLFAVAFCFAEESADEEKEILNIAKIGVFKCGRQPKQVLFSPDNNYVLLPLLDDNGFDVFSVAEKKVIKRIAVPSGNKKGFAEGLFIPEKNVFLVSQMTTACVYEYSYPEFNYKRTLQTEGEWSKFIAFSKEKSMLAVSNWISNDISLIDYETGNLIEKLKTAAAPRGIIFTDNGNKLISLSFDAGKIERFDINTKKKTDTISVSKAAMRHVVVNSAEDTAFISDMYHRSVYKLDLEKFEITATTRVFNNPNTIDLLNDKYLFVSCRGPNNPEDYTLRSLVNGKICIINTETMKVVQEIEGGNQPTGLDISNDGKYLCFSDFQDASLELYSIEF